MLIGLKSVERNHLKLGTSEVDKAKTRYKNTRELTESETKGINLTRVQYKYHPSNTGPLILNYRTGTGTVRNFMHFFSLLIHSKMREFGNRYKWHLSKLYLREYLPTHEAIDYSLKL